VRVGSLSNSANSKKSKLKGKRDFGNKREGIVSRRSQTGGEVAGNGEERNLTKRYRPNLKIRCLEKYLQKGRLNFRRWGVARDRRDTTSRSIKGGGRGILNKL